MLAQHRRVNVVVTQFFLDGFAGQGLNDLVPEYNVPVMVRLKIRGNDQSCDGKAKNSRQ
jgi:hypothetical protein